MGEGQAEKVPVNPLSCHDLQIFFFEHSFTEKKKRTKDEDKKVKNNLNEKLILNTTKTHQRLLKSLASFSFSHYSSLSLQSPYFLICGITLVPTWFSTASSISSSCFFSFCFFIIKRFSFVCCR